MESWGPLLVFRGEEEMAVQMANRGHLVTDLELTWLYPTNTAQRFAEPVYEVAFRDLAGVGLPSAGTIGVDELFTGQQAQTLCTHLHDWFDEDQSTHEIEQPDFPLDSDYIGFSSMPLRSEAEFYMLSQNPGFPLDFDVWGYYNLRRHKTMQGVYPN